MNKYLLFFTTSTIILAAQNISLSEKQEKNWKILTEIPTVSTKTPLGNFMARVVAPPYLMHVFSLPFDANIKQLNVAKYQKVKKGDLLAKATGTEWIAVQQKAISEAIEFRHHTHLTERKNILCKEEIIAKKECTAANAELKSDKIRVLASKALLKSYGASEAMIGTLFSSFKLSETTEIKSIVDGRIVKINATLGKSFTPNDTLFVVQSRGNLWLESDISKERVEGLVENKSVHIKYGAIEFNTTILQIAPVVNPENQTMLVRFLLPESLNLLPGSRDNIEISFTSNSLRIKKTSVIKYKDRQIVFLKIKGGYQTHSVKILAEDNLYYYVEPDVDLDVGIAVSSVAILKSILGDGDE